MSERERDRTFGAKRILKIYAINGTEPGKLFALKFVKTVVLVAPPPKFIENYTFFFQCYWLVWFCCWNLTDSIIFQKKICNHSKSKNKTLTNFSNRSQNITYLYQIFKIFKKIYFNLKDLEIPNPKLQMMFTNPNSIIPLLNGIQVFINLEILNIFIKIWYGWTFSNKFRINYSKTYLIFFKI